MEGACLLSKSPPWWEETGIHGELKESAIQVVTEGHTRGKMLTSTKESESFTREAALELVLEGGNFSGAGGSKGEEVHTTRTGYTICTKDPVQNENVGPFDESSFRV